MIIILILRTITYASLFAGLVFIYFPSHLLSWSGIAHPSAYKLEQIAGMVIAAIGAVLAFWCIFTFISVGRGTPAPFDPPRRLVMKGPYRYVRNPMYIGAGLVLLGTALFYESLIILGYAIIFILIAHVFVLFYEEPTLMRNFGKEYKDYRRRVKRWWLSR